MKPATRNAPALVPLLLLVPLAAGCGPAPREQPLEIETVDVTPPIDAELTTDNDLEAVQRAASVSGLVPGDVPPDLPLFVPSSVIDFGAPQGGPAFVTFDASAPPDEVRRWLGSRLPAAGWQVAAIGDASVEARKGGQTVEYRLTALRPGTRIRLEYPPRR